MSRFRLTLTPLRLALIVALLLSTVRLRGSRYIDQLDARLSDYRLLQRGVQSVSPAVTIVAVDDASLDELGRWPWSRAVVARLVDRLTDAGAAVVGFDIVQSEATAALDVELLRDNVAGVDESTWDKLRAAMAEGAVEDKLLAESLKRSRRAVLGYFFTRNKEQQSADSRVSVYNLVSGKGITALREGRFVTGNLAILNAVARDTGYFDIDPDPDGYLRRAFLAQRHGEDVAVPLSLAMLRAKSGEQLRIRFDSGDPPVERNAHVESIRLGATEIPVDDHGQLLINYRGPGGTFVPISAADVIAGRADPERLKDKLVLVGVTAKAVYDLRVTPFDQRFPGVETHANIIDNILRHDFIRRPGWARNAEVGLILGLGLLLTLLLHYARGALGAAVAIGVLAAYLFGSQWVFQSQGIVISVLYPVATLFLTYSSITVHQYVTQDREKRRQRKALELYLSPSLAAIVSDHGDELKLGGEKRDYTVLFSDVRGFTTIAEQLDADVLVAVLNDYLGAMTDVIFEHDGMLDKYIGDGIMAIWGAPLPQAEHARLACQTALHMNERLEQKRAEWHAKGWPEMAVRIGLHTGPMIFGNMGSAQHLSMTVVGDNVNLGARLEGLNKMYDTSIIASESTVIAAVDPGVVRELDLVRVVGRSQPVRVYELLARSEAQAQWAPLIAHFEAGLQAYRKQQWQDARREFEAVLALRPDDGPALVYLERCASLSTNPPPMDWDGVSDMLEK